ncbi:MAG: hypothetical protein R2799_11700 [Crocinitomicaceae bacterium]
MVGRVFLLGVVLFLGLTSYAQIYGELGTSKREIAADCDRKLSASGTEGLIFISIVVNRDGEVTSAVLEEVRSTVSNTMLVREALIRAKKMKFAADYTAPQWHKGTIEFKVEKKSAGNEELKRKNILPENY